MKSNIGVLFSNRQVILTSSDSENLYCKDNVVYIPFRRFTIVINSLQTDAGRNDEYVVLSSITKPVNSCTPDIYMSRTYYDTNVRLYSPLVSIKLVLETPSILIISHDFLNPILFCTILELK